MLQVRGISVDSLIVTRSRIRSLDRLSLPRGAGAHIIILSGGYGAALAGELIGMYDAPLNPAWWANRILERSLIAYAQRHTIASSAHLLPQPASTRKFYAD